MITQAVQDYLKVIYKLSKRGKSVSTNAIAERLQVAQASVTGMMKKLSELKLITHKPYYGVQLTQYGNRIALEIIRHHRLLELYLAKALGYPWDRVHEEAEKLEHHISEEFEDRMAEYLGHPTTDPHGAPIPGKDGHVPQRKVLCLTDVEVGQRVTVAQVSDNDPEMLRYLGNIGIYPNVQMDIIDRAPFDGPLNVRVGDVDHHLGNAVTDNIMVVA
jgi:DtxR family Mn-dependent transcriptional regulator